MPSSHSRDRAEGRERREGIGDRIASLPLGIILLLLVASFFSSLLFETLLPLAERGDYWRMAATSSGIVLIILAMIFLLRSLAVLLLELSGSRGVVGVRGAMARSLIWFILGMVLLLTGAYLINL